MVVIVVYFGRVEREQVDATMEDNKAIAGEILVSACYAGVRFPAVLLYLGIRLPTPRVIFLMISTIIFWFEPLVITLTDYAHCNKQNIHRAYNTVIGVSVLHLSIVLATIRQNIRGDVWCHLKPEARD